MRVANVFFLIIAILQSIPAISPLGAATAWVPLIVVLAISIIREGTIHYIQGMKTINDIFRTKD